MKCPECQYKFAWYRPTTGTYKTCPGCGVRLKRNRDSWGEACSPLAVVVLLSILFIVATIDAIHNSYTYALTFFLAFLVMLSKPFLNTIFLKYESMKEEEKDS